MNFEVCHLIFMRFLSITFNIFIKLAAHFENIEYIPQQSTLFGFGILFPRHMSSEVYVL